MEPRTAPRGLRRHPGAHQERPKEAPERAPRGPKSEDQLVAGSNMIPKRPQDSPKVTQDDPRQPANEAPRGPHDANANSLARRAMGVLDPGGPGGLRTSLGPTSAKEHPRARQAPLRAPKERGSMRVRPHAGPKFVPR